MLLGALGGVLPPVPARDPDAGEEQGNKQDRQQPAGTAVFVVAGPANEKQLGVTKRVGAHEASPSARSVLISADSRRGCDPIGDWAGWHVDLRRRQISRRRQTPILALRAVTDDAPFTILECVSNCIPATDQHARAFASAGDAVHVGAGIHRSCAVDADRTRCHRSLRMPSLEMRKIPMDLLSADKQTIRWCGQQRGIVCIKLGNCIRIASCK
jgi:hypothetical protein